MSLGKLWSVDPSHITLDSLQSTSSCRISFALYNKRRGAGQVFITTLTYRWFHHHPRTSAVTEHKCIHPRLWLKTGMSTQATPTHTFRQNMSWVSFPASPPPPPRPLLWSKAKNFSFKEKQMFCKRQTSFASIFLSALLILLFYCSLSGSPEVGRSGSTSREFKCGPPACWAEGKGRLEGLPCDFQWTLGFWGTMGLPKSTATWWDRCSFSIWVRSPSQEGRRA